MGTSVEHDPNNVPKRSDRANPVRANPDRGTAIVEAVIVLPVIILIFASLIMMMEMYVKRLVINNQARSCAWQRAIHEHCDGGTPQACTNGDAPVLIPVFRAANNQDPNDAMNDVKTNMPGGQSGPGGSLLQTLDPLGSAYRFNVNAQVARRGPFRVAGANADIHATFSMVCNTRPANVYSLAHDLGEMLKDMIN